MRPNHSYERQQQVVPVVASAEQPCYYLQPDKGNIGSAAAAKRSQPSGSGGLQQTLAGSFAKVTPYARNSKKWEKLTGAVTFCLAIDVMPIYSVEKPGFQQLLKEFDPQYVLPSRKYFSNTAIPTLYAKTCEKVVSEVGHAQHFAATTDVWSSTTTEPYISYIVHFIYRGQLGAAKLLSADHVLS